MFSKFLHRQNSHRKWSYEKSRHLTNSLHSNTMPLFGNKRFMLDEMPYYLAKWWLKICHIFEIWKQMYVCWSQFFLWSESGHEFNWFPAKKTGLWLDDLSCRSIWGLLFGGKPLELRSQKKLTSQFHFVIYFIFLVLMCPGRQFHQVYLDHLFLKNDAVWKGKNWT